MRVLGLDNLQRPNTYNINRVKELHAKVLKEVWTLHEPVIAKMFSGKGDGLLTK